MDSVLKKKYASGHINGLLPSAYGQGAIFIGDI